MGSIGGRGVAPGRGGGGIERRRGRGKWGKAGPGSGANEEFVVRAMHWGER